MGKIIVISLVFLFLMASCLIVTKPVSGSSAVENSWTEKAPVPSPQGDDQAAVVNGIIYLVGAIGHYDAAANSYVVTSIHYAYNPSNDTWTTISPMPTPRVSFAIATCNNKIYVIGGHEAKPSDMPLSSVNEVYDPSTNSWSTAAPMPTVRGVMRAETVNGKIYVMGGRTGGMYSTVNTTDIYDPVTDSWSTGASMPYSVNDYASAVVDNKIFVIGGYDEWANFPYVQYTQIYNPANDTWSLGSSIPTTAFSPGAGATTGFMAPKKIYVFGGMVGFAIGSNQTYAYDPTSNSWTSAAPMPTARFGATAAVVNDIFYVIGGSGYNGNAVHGVAGVANNEQYTPVGYGTPDPSYMLEHAPPEISLLSPLNQTYNDSSVPLVFTVNKLLAWASYSLDGQQNITITGNGTLTNMTNGLHDVTVYANDSFGNIGVSEPSNFTVALTPLKNSQPFPTVTVTAISGVAAVVVVGAGLLVYFKKRKRG